MRDINIVKYRKLLYQLQFFCRQKKRYLYEDIFSAHKRKKLTDFERGRIEGKHSAYNDILRKLQEMSEGAEYDWASVHCREEN